VKISAAVNGAKTIAVTEIVGGDLEWGDGTDVDATPDNDFINVNGTGTAISIADVSGAETALTTITSAINAKDTTRAKLGYLMNRLEAAKAVIDIQAENLLAAESRISDVDVATETTALTRNQVLAQAGVAMLAQANSMPQMALNLLA
jgi:flagellin